MNPKTTGALAVVALLLGAFVYLYEIGGDPGREAAKDEAARIFGGIDAASISSVEITTREGTPARFELREGAWFLTQPVLAKADATALDAITHALSHLPREGDVKTPRGMSEYGLAETARTVRFDVTRQGQTDAHVLRIGRSTPVGGHLYVTRDEEAEVAFVESYRVNAFNRNLDDLRERRIFGFEAGAVRALDMRWQKPESDEGWEQVALRRGDAGLWELRSPLQAPADEETLREFLSNLSFLRAESFVDMRSEEVEAAFEGALVQVSWQKGADASSSESSAGTHGSARFAMGDEAGTLLVDAGPGSEVAYRIPVERLDDIPRSINAFRFKQLASFELVAARRLEFEFARPEESAGAEPVRLTAELDDGGWSSDDRALNPDALSDLVRQLSTLRAEDVFADEMGPAERASLGLSPPRSVIRVLGREGEPVLAEIRMGRLDSRRGLFAQRLEEPTIYLLAGPQAESLPISLEAFESSLGVPESPEPEPEPEPESDPAEPLTE